jgi:hypothetical protein
MKIFHQHCNVFFFGHLVHPLSDNSIAQKDENVNTQMKKIFARAPPPLPLLGLGGIWHRLGAGRA